MGIVILAGVLIAMIWGKLSYDGWQKRRRRMGQRKGPRLGLGSSGRRREDGSYEPDYDSDDYDSGDDGDDGTLAAVTADMVADQEGKFRCQRTVQAEQQRKHNRRAGTGRSRKDRSQQLAHGHGDCDRPRDFIPQFFSAQPEFHRQEGNTAEQHGNRDRFGIVRA